MMLLDAHNILFWDIVFRYFLIRQVASTKKMKRNYTSFILRKLTRRVLTLVFLGHLKSDGGSFVTKGSALSS